MKKIICLLLVILMIMSIASCGETQSDADGETEKTATEGKVEAEKYDGIFKVGYASVDISYTEAEMPFTRAIFRRSLTGSSLDLISCWEAKSFPVANISSAFSINLSVA